MGAFKESKKTEAEERKRGKKRKERHRKRERERDGILSVKETQQTMLGRVACCSARYSGNTHNNSPHNTQHMLSI